MSAQNLSIIAQQLEARFNAVMLSHGLESNALLAAGVPQHTVESLYPFEMEDYIPFVRQTLQTPEQLEAVARLLGDHELNMSFSVLPESCSAEADRLVWFHSYFDGDDELANLYVKFDDAPEVTGNAIFIMKQWGYLLVFLHQCATCLSLPQEKCADDCWEHHCKDRKAFNRLRDWLAEMEEISTRLLALIAPAGTEGS